VQKSKKLLEFSSRKYLPDEVMLLLVCTLSNLCRYMHLSINLNNVCPQQISSTALYNKKRDSFLLNHVATAIADLTKQQLFICSRLSERFDFGSDVVARNIRLQFVIILNRIIKA